jgi:small subunit ribosomal protein S1
MSAVVAPALTRSSTVDAFIGVLNKQPHKHVLQLLESNAGNAKEHEVPRAAPGISSIPVASFLGVSFAAAIGAIAKRRRNTARRCMPLVDPEGGPVVHEVIPRDPNERKPFTPEKEASFLQTRISALKELMPQTDEEFDDDLEELHWQWCRVLLPYTDRNRQEVANHKRRVIKREKEFFQDLRLFKPLAVKYPTLMRRDRASLPDMQNNRMTLMGDYINNEEKIAGFTYEDFVKEITSATGEGWTKPQPGEIVPGIVTAVSADGAFVDVGGKTWAYMSLNNISLAPITNASEVLSVGQEIEAMITGYRDECLVAGDPTATQLTLSLTELQKEASWDEIEAIMRADPDTEPIMQVNVRAMRTWGAVVQTRKGLFGWVPNAELAGLMGDTSIVGTEIAVEIMRASRDKDDTQDTAMPVSPNDFAITFSHKNAATKVLATKMQEGQVVDAKILTMDNKFLAVDVDGIQVNIRKIDISSNPKFQIADLFDLGEIIKCYALTVNESSGEIRLSIRALEAKKGELILDKKKVFDMAEETGKEYFENSKKEKEKLFMNLEETISQGKASSVESILGDDDDDAGF